MGLKSFSSLQGSEAGVYRFVKTKLRGLSFRISGLSVGVRRELGMIL